MTKRNIHPSDLNQKAQDRASAKPAGDVESIDLKRSFTVIGQRLHNAFSQLPRALKITKPDAIDMYKRVDQDARIRSLPYWLFIIASCGISTLGLIIDSPAVIIGAMLVSPLMAPIIGLGMGVALNDIYLSVKSIINIGASLLVAVLTSALITLLVPINELNTEIMARTNPTILDLFIAIFCGLVAALSSVRSRGHEIMKSVAPGAAIGVALMPPICVIGFGLGIGFNWTMMWGAFLLFTTNLIAIVFVTSLFYYFTYNQYSVPKLLQLVEPTREKEETFYKGRYKPLWRTWLQGNKGARRLLFPSLLILVILYPLMTSLVYLRTQIEINNLIKSRLVEMDSGIQIVRGTDSLTYTRESVTGNILYSSKENPGPQFTEKIRKEIEDNFSGFKASINLMRIANTSDLVKLQKLNQNKELSLDTSPNTLHDSVRHAYATDLVRRALELLNERFPEEFGVIQKVKLGFAITGMDTISIHYLGRHLSASNLRQLSAVYRKELQALQADVRHVELIYAGPDKARVGCRKHNTAETLHKATLEAGQLLLQLTDNPFLSLELKVDQTIADSIKANYSKVTLQRVQLSALPDPYCAIDYHFKPTDL